MNIPCSVALSRWAFHSLLTRALALLPPVVLATRVIRKKNVNRKKKVEKNGQTGREWEGERKMKASLI